jgi:hypothetical protein
MYVARQLGHDARLTLSIYGHVIDELDDSPQILPRTRSQPTAAARVSPVCHRRQQMGGAEATSNLQCTVFTGHPWYGARGTRTPDLLGAIQALSQLSYSPEEGTVYPGVVAAKATGMARTRRYADDT